MKGENSPSSPPDLCQKIVQVSNEKKKLFWRLGDNLRKSGGLCFFLWHLGLDRISYGRHANCVQVLGSQPTHSRAAEMWKSVARRTGDLSA